MDLVSTEEVVKWVLAGLVVLMVITRIVKSLKGGPMSLLRKLNIMATDFNGTPSRPGVPAIPGVMERLAALEAHRLSDLKNIDAKFEELHKTITSAGDDNMEEK